MPELPEVETTMRGLTPLVKDKTIEAVILRHHTLRVPLPSNLHALLQNQTIEAISRRAKYLIFTFERGDLLIHLGMSGSLYVVKPEHPIKAHSHVDFVFSNQTIMRYTDPRRFGLVLWVEREEQPHPLLQHLGPEPLTDDFNSTYFMAYAKKRRTPVKSLLMNNAFVVGIGNIYAQEALFRARIHPLVPVMCIDNDEASRLVAAVKAILNQAITVGGTTLRDFYHSDGKPGYFAQSLNVYGRNGFPCFTCQTTIASITLGGRTTAFCPVCQPR